MNYYYYEEEEEEEEEEATAQTYTAKPNRETNQTNSSTTYKELENVVAALCNKEKKEGLRFVLSFAFVNPPLLLYTGKACKKAPFPVLMAKRGGTSSSLWGLV